MRATSPACASTSPTSIRLSTRSHRQCCLRRSPSTRRARSGSCVPPIRTSSSGRAGGDTATATPWTAAADPRVADQGLRRLHPRRAGAADRSRRHAAAALDPAATSALPARCRHPQRRGARSAAAPTSTPPARLWSSAAKATRSRWYASFSDELWRAFIAYRNRPIQTCGAGDRESRSTRPRLDTDYLFFRHGVKSGAITWTDPHKPISQRGLHSWWAEYVIPAAGVRYRSMHMNRHTVGTDLASAEADAFCARRSATGSATPTCRPPPCVCAQLAVTVEARPVPA